MRTVAFSSNSKRHQNKAFAGITLSESKGIRTVPEDPDERKEIYEWLNNGVKKRDARFLQFWHRRNLIASLTWVAEEMDSYYEGQQFANIDNVVVAKNHRKQGHGAALMKCAHKEIQKAGIDAVYLYPAQAAVDFYLQLGYDYDVPEGEDPEQDLDLLNMIISL